MAPSNNTIFPQRPTTPTPSQIHQGLHASLIVARRGVEQGDKQPFAAVLVGPDNETVLLSHGNVDHVNHAEASLARLAAAHYAQAYLWRCTLYTTWEPCAMCVATCYWANVGRVVYGVSEARLAGLTGMGVEENMTMAMPCRRVLEGSQKDVRIIGPLPDDDPLVELVVRESDEFWRPFREAKASQGNRGS